MDSDSLRKFINNWVEPNDEEWLAFASKLKVRQLSKDEIYHKEGNISRHVALVTKGAVRMFYNIEGEERSKDFQFEGQFTGSLASLLTQTPSKFSVAALEDTTLIEISGEDLSKLYDTYKVWERFGRLYMTLSFLYKEKREASLLFDSSTTRYEKLVQEQPEHVQRIPLKHLASYLGIKPETLSRIRRELLKKMKTKKQS
jgi:CRP-like cAMP-binding protein